MQDSSSESHLVSLVDMVVGGRVSAADAGRGMSDDALQILCIAQSLGDMSRDLPGCFTSRQAGIFHRMIDGTVDAYFLGRAPATPRELVAARLTDLAFNIGDPGAWAAKLAFIRDAEDRESRSAAGV